MCHVRKRSSLAYVLPLSQESYAPSSPEVQDALDGRSGSGFDVNVHLTGDDVGESRLA